MSIIIRRERRLRATAKKQGFRIVKSRLRNPALPRYGCYMLVDPGDFLVCGSGPEPWTTLDAIADYLTDHAAPMSPKQRGTAMIAADKVARKDQQERQRAAA